MRTTLELPDDLMRTLKVRAAQSDRTLTDVTTEVIRRGLVACEVGGTADVRVQLPIVRNSRTARAEDFSPERIADILEASDVNDLIQPGG